MKRPFAKPLLTLVGIGLAALLCAPPAQAQTNPAARSGGRTIRLIVPYAPGGVSDVLSRLLAPALGDGLGQTVVVENKAGGNSIIGTDAVAKAPPDGQTIGMIDLAFLVNPSLFQLPYDTVKDFSPIARVARAPLVLMAHPSLPAKSLTALRDLARSRPGQVSYASAGVGTAVHIAGEQMALAFGAPLLHASYRGGALPINAVVGGEVNLAFISYIQARPLVENGQVLGLGITGDRRAESMPNVPSFAEAGFPAVDAATVNGLIAPAGTSPELIARMAAIVTEAMAKAEMRQRLAEVCCDPAVLGPAEFGGYIQSEIAKWGMLVRDAKIQAN